MGLARELARLRPNSSGLLPNANIEAMAASKLTGQVPDANAPSGSVIQVVYGETSSLTSWSSLTDWTDTGITATITPSNTSSRILIMVDGKFGGTDSGINFTLRLLRNGSLLYAGTDTNMKQGFAHFEQGWSAFQYFIMPANATTVDSPSSTSALTYKVQLRPNGTGSIIYMNRTHNNSASQATTRSSITLLEIAA